MENTFCQTCGVSDNPNHLVFCSTCKTSAEHWYCMFVLPETDKEIIWSCEECAPTFPKSSSHQEYDEDLPHPPFRNKAKRYAIEDDALQNHSSSSKHKPSGQWTKRKKYMKPFHGHGESDIYNSNIHKYPFAVDAHSEEGKDGIKKFNNLKIGQVITGMEHHFNSITHLMRLLAPLKESRAQEAILLKQKKSINHNMSFVVDNNKKLEAECKRKDQDILAANKKLNERDHELSKVIKEKEKAELKVRQCSNKVTRTLIDLGYYKEKCKELEIENAELRELSVNHTEAEQLDAKSVEIDQMKHCISHLEAQTASLTQEHDNMIEFGIQCFDNFNVVKIHEWVETHPKKVALQHAECGRASNASNSKEG
ncbi:hypothetical protein ZOSMA_137G00350 [Zostera marina]|uniref:PHD-type domain-containing protein n=1 Tax=Zostera marina TaxID=29655 RepID=A0A0K9PY72_ZOSMR|nr:hypothetical protein ZOSMA_137G00350 [Zostera marina]